MCITEFSHPGTQSFYAVPREHRQRSASSAIGKIAEAFAARSRFYLSCFPAF